MAIKIQHHGTRQVEHGDFVSEHRVRGQNYTIVGSFQLHTYLNQLRIAFSLPGAGPVVERWETCTSLDGVAFAADKLVYQVLMGFQRDGEVGEFGEL